MKKNKISEAYSGLSLRVKIVRFLEDGYEIVLSPDEDVDIDFEKVAAIQIDGFSVVSITKRNFKYTILLVPVSLDEMIDFVWKYVEKFGDKDSKVIDSLGDAVCVLERAIDTIPPVFGDQKQTALHNFDKFTSQIF